MRSASAQTLCVPRSSPSPADPRMLIDARTVEDGAELRCDVCVVGAGPAGRPVVHRLRDSGLSICLLERGGFEPDLRTQRLYRGSYARTPVLSSGHVPFSNIRLDDVALGRVVPAAGFTRLPGAPRMGCPQRLADRPR